MKESTSPKWERARGTRGWFVVRSTTAQGSVTQEELTDIRGNLRRFGSPAAAQRAADAANRKEGLVVEPWSEGLRSLFDADRAWRKKRALTTAQLSKVRRELKSISDYQEHSIMGHRFRRLHVTVQKFRVDDRESLTLEGIIKKLSRERE